MTNAHSEPSAEIFVPILLIWVQKILLMMHSGSRWTERRNCWSWSYWKSAVAQIVSFFYSPSRHTQLTILDFSMPTLNFIFPFLETVRPESDPCWHIRRGRLLHHYELVWVVCNDEYQPNSIIFDGEAQFKTVEICDKSHVILCLVPKWWIISLSVIHNSSSKDTGFSDKLWEACLLLV